MNTLSTCRTLGAAAGIAALGLFLAALGTAPAAADTPAGPPPSAPYVHTGPWVSDPTMSSQLGKTAFADDYAINPPAQYTQIIRKSPDGFGVIYDWTSAKRSDGSQPTLDVIVAHAPKGEASQFKPDDILTNFLSNLKVHKLTWSVSAMQDGTVDGIKFERAHYTGVEEVMGNPGDDTHGFVYVAEPSPGQFLIMNGEDAMPYADTTLPVLEDSALTVRAKDAPAPPGAPKD